MSGSGRSGHLPARRDEGLREDTTSVTVIFGIQPGVISPIEDGKSACMMYIKGDYRSDYLGQESRHSNSSCRRDSTRLI